MKRRIELIDVAKAVTIFLVILGHTTGNLETPMYRRVLYSFHMPLFFLLAGLSIKPAILHSFIEWRRFFKKNILAIVVPFVIWGLIYAPFSVANLGNLFYGSWKSLVDMGTLSSLWYLSCLFVARIFVQIIMNLFARCKNSVLTPCFVLSGVVMNLIAFLLPHIEGGYPWCADVAFMAAGWILFGIAFRLQVLIFAQQRTSVLILSFIASLVLFYFGTIFRGDSLDLSLMCNGVYGNKFWFIYNSVFGSLVVLIFSMLICRVARESAHPFSVDAITYIGKRTLGIFLIHKNILWLLLMPLANAIFPENTNALLIAFIASVFALGLSILGCMVIEKYIPQLLGQFPREYYKKEEK